MVDKEVIHIRIMSPLRALITYALKTLWVVTLMELVMKRKFPSIRIIIFCKLLGFGNARYEPYRIISNTKKV